MGKKRINDGLNKWQRYRLKDLEGYRKIKRELARTPQHRKKRAEYMQEWRKKYPEKVRLISRNYYKNNRDQIKIKQRRYNLKRLYGLTEADYQRMLADQGGVCKICLGEARHKKGFHVDHDHVTGRVRAILCSRCNGALGWFEKYAKNILDYLK